MLGLHVQMRSNMGVAGLDRSTRDGWPVVCPIRRPPAAGHWVAVTGVTPRSILVYDPSAGHCAIDRHDWLACWRDSADGVEYVRLGISVGLWR
jgi:hypothetical protein